MGTIVRAAGAVLWREQAGALEIAVVHRPGHGDWSLPKGKLADGETELEAARREVTEETGYQAEPGAGIGETRYPVGGRAEKVVAYWAMRAGDGAFAPNREVDELRWLEPDSARSLLTYERDREVLDRFLAAWAEPATGE